MARTKQRNLNGQITSDPVRVIGSDGNQLGIVSLEDAIAVAAEENLDLVEISPSAAPPVCKVMDYGKFLYNENKKRQDAKKKQKQITIKEIKFRPGTDVGDYQIKLRKLTEFLQVGNKTKVTMRFRGREMAHKELGLEMLDRVGNDLADIAEIEQTPALEGRQMVMVMAPKRR